MTATIPVPSDQGRPFDIVFLDRDGTINARVPRYVTSGSELVLLPGAARAVADLNRSGARVVVVTNQRGIGTGELSAEQLDEVHATLAARLSEEGAHLDAIYVCPHEEGTCRCRKPGTGLFEAALEAAPWAEPARCVMVGDMVTDVLPASRLGLRAILVGDGTPHTGWERADDLAGAVDRLLGRQSSMQREGR